MFCQCLKWTWWTFSKLRGDLLLYMFLYIITRNFRCLFLLYLLFIMSYFCWLYWTVKAKKYLCFVHVCCHFLSVQTLFGLYSILHVLVLLVIVLKLAMGCISWFSGPSYHNLAHYSGGLIIMIINLFFMINPRACFFVPCFWLLPYSYYHYLYIYISSRLLKAFTLVIEPLKSMKTFYRFKIFAFSKKIKLNMFLESLVKSNGTTLSLTSCFQERFRIRFLKPLLSIFGPW